MNKVDQTTIDYTSYAPRYDADRHHGSKNGYMERIRDRALWRLVSANARTTRTIDVGCGTGRGLLTLGRFGFLNLTGLDYTAAMLQTAENRISSELTSDDSHREIRLIRGDAFLLPFNSDSFDLVISLNFLHMFRFDLQQKIVNELTRICAPGGQLVLEFESIHKGLFFTRYWEQRRLRHRTKFNSMREVHALFDSRVFANVRILGTVLPKAYLLFHHFPRIGEYFESLAYLPPINWMASRVLVSGQKR